MDRMPPASIEAEQAVLGAMLLKPDAVTTAAEELSADDFYRETHRLIFEAMMELKERTEPVDLVTLTEQLKKADKLAKIGGIPALSLIANSVPTAANVHYHARIVHEKAQLRSLINAATEIAGAAYESADEVEDIMDSAEKRILAVSSGKRSKDFVPLQDILLDTLEQIDLRYNNKGSITGLPTGFTELDHLTAGLQKSDLILVAARPSMGKTAFTLNIAAHVVLRAKEPVAFFSLEMSKEQLVQRLLCSEGRIDSQRLRVGELEEKEWGDLIDTANRLSAAPLYIDDTPGITVMELRSKARRLKAEHGLSLIVIDYLQLMQGRGNKSGDNRQQEISEISRSLKALARELNVPVIALSQLSRSVESRQIKRPMLSDLRESGSLEQDADIVMFLYREDYYDPETENKNITEVIIAKHRNGPVDTVDLTFLKQFTKFGNLSRMQ
ncbi:replicative DNA helicase [Selenomonas sputigena]|uniref:Replicative DNA helicase n=1 Tax=Selenomonas sputigena (strain ATCC 35185 / DSM 20758 / CCUG 44933 / VPI D19B-28) TaxID=546271 RepID=C9LYM1_SELS3|nr:replicative DNA helicase [Selenomonas sputigena]AEC01001.1 replicative DNA helicase [Selenomonas sputigena ATCC 35185]EEX75971.1 replicative DNA helicase [Selenomonas sputigena ATCC 35185]